MKPYYEDDYVTLYHGDSLELADVWAAADVLVTDPPYGMAYVSNSGKSGPTAAIAGDADLHARDGMFAAWGDDKPALVFGTWLVERPSQTRHLLVWDKGESPGMGDLSIPWGPSHEEVYVCGSGFTGKRGASVLRVPTMSAGDKRRPNHPTPKPVPLMELLIEKTLGVVADPFTGSGATLLAARNLGRRAIGVELEEKYCEVTAKRLESTPLPLTATDPVLATATSAFDFGGDW